jgi:O-antigen/teichoic acid export membrane protein
MEMRGVGREMAVGNVTAGASGERDFIGRVLGTATTSGIIALIGFMTGVLGARLLGPDGRGELAAMQMWPSTLATIAMLGLPDSLVYYSARESGRAGRYLGSAVALALLSSVLFIGVGYLAMPGLLGAQSSETVAAARCYLLLLAPIFVVVGMPIHPLRGLSDFISWNALRLMPSVGWLVVLVGAWGFDRAQPATLAFGNLAMLAVLVIPVALTVWRRIPGPFRPDPRAFGSLLRYGLPSAAGAVPSMFAARLDLLVITALLPVQALGLYAVSVAWGSAVQPLVGSLGTVVFPHIAALNSAVAQKEALAAASRLSVVTSLVSTGGLLALTPIAVPLLFGVGFNEAVPSACLLVVAAGIGMWSFTVEDGLRGIGRPGVALLAELGGLVTLSLGLALLTNSFALAGVASATVGARAATALVLIVATYRLGLGPASAFFFPSESELRLVLGSVLQLCSGTFEWMIRRGR